MANPTLDIPALMRAAITPPAPSVPDAARQVMQSKAVIRRINRVLAERAMETLTMYTPIAAVEAFHASNHQWRILDGGNQTSKTSSALIEFARAVCNVDPWGKYPKGPLKTQMIGLEKKHLANPLYSKLFEPGAFSMIQDEQTRLWRFLRVDKDNPTQIDPYDLAYQEKWKDAPPIIPPRMLKGEVAMDDKKKGIPAIATLVNGTIIEFISSESKPRRGNQSHVAFFDEDLENDGHITEFARGAMRFNGKGIWAATPQTMNERLQDFREAAERGESHVMRTLLLKSDNPFILAQSRKNFEAVLTPEEVAIRIHGESAVGGQRIYAPLTDAHTCEPFDIPDDWAVYCSLDPGRRHIGTVMAAVPPDESHVYVYEGFEVQDSGAVAWAGAVHQRDRGHQFQAFIIDQQAGRQNPMMFEITVAKKSWEGIIEAGIEPVQRGPMSGFMLGTNNVRGREETLKSWMEIRGSGPFTGTPRLQIFRGRCPLLERQLKRARTDHKRVDKRFEQIEDVLVALEYLVGYGPRYKEPPPIEPPKEKRNPKLVKMLKRNKQFAR